MEKKEYIRELEKKTKDDIIQMNYEIAVELSKVNNMLSMKDKEVEQLKNRCSELEKQVLKNPKWSKEDDDISKEIFDKAKKLYSEYGRHNINYIIECMLGNDGFDDKQKPIHKVDGISRDSIEVKYEGVKPFLYYKNKKLGCL